MEIIKAPIYVKLTEEERKPCAMPMTFSMNYMTSSTIMTASM